MGMTTEMTWMQAIFQSLRYIVFVFGLWKIFVKCGQKGWWALIPGLQYYKLGECAHRENEGVILTVIHAILFVPSYLLPLVMVSHPAQISRPLLLLTLAFVVLGLVGLIFEIRIYLGLCDTFGRKRWWVIFWIWEASAWIPALLWGASEAYQPVNLHRVDDDELLAGTTPAEIGLQLEEKWADASFADIVISETAGKGDQPKHSGLIIDLHDRTVRDFLKRRYLLKDMQLIIPNGSLVLLLGGSGAGKTTFVNAITGYEPANATMLLNGQDIYKDYDQMKYRIGFVPQQDLLRMNDTVAKTLKDAASLRLPAGTSARQEKERINSVMETLGLTAGKNGLVSKKSGGQKKRISIGMELISDPELFILDEPDSGLDGVIARELFSKLRDVADEGHIVIAITHTPDRVIDLFDRVIVLARDSGRVGRLAFYGAPEDARSFFGKKSMEEIVMSVNRKAEGGEGRADEFVEKYAAARANGSISPTGRKTDKGEGVSAASEMRPGKEVSGNEEN